jgi:hypothetical protein
VRVGRLRGPDLEDAKQPIYRWEATSKADLARVAELIGPWLGTIKHAQFAHALGSEVQVSIRAGSMTEELAWAGGLYDGEGSASLTPHRSHLGHFSPEVAITQLGDEVPEVLVRTRAALGCGRVYGPYDQDRTSLPVYRWKAQSHHDVHFALYTLLPWIGTVKRDQARRVLRVLVEQGRLPRGNPAFGVAGSRYCLRGHDKLAARIRSYVSRGGAWPNPYARQCLACSRERARLKRLGSNG